MEFTAEALAHATEVTDQAPIPPSVEVSDGKSDIEVAQGRAGITRRGAVAGLLAGGVAGFLAACGVNYSEEDIEAKRILSSLRKNAGILGKITRAQVKRSLEISNSPEYLRLVDKTYKFLVENGIWQSNKRFQVLFLDGVDDPGIAVALADVNIIVVGLGAFEGKDKDAQLKLLAPKISHEGTHLLNHQTNPRMSILEDEYLAYKATYDCAVVLDESAEIIENQKLIYKAFEVLINERDTVCEILGVDLERFNNINYEFVNISEGQVIIGLYSMDDLSIRGVFGVNVDTKEITKMRQRTESRQGLKGLVRDFYGDEAGFFDVGRAVELLGEAISFIKKHPITIFFIMSVGVPIIIYYPELLFILLPSGGFLAATKNRMKIVDITPRQEQVVGKALAPILINPELLLGDKLISAFRELNGGESPLMVDISGQRKICESELRRCLDLIDEKDQNKFIIVTLAVQYDDRVEYKTVVDRVKHIKQYQIYILNGQVALEDYEYLRDFVVYPAENYIHLRYQSIGKNHKDKLRGRGIVSEIFGRLADVLEKDYMGMKVYTIDVEGKYRAPEEQVILRLMRRYFSAEHPSLDTEFMRTHGLPNYDRYALVGTVGERGEQTIIEPVVEPVVEAKPTTISEALKQIAKYSDLDAIPENLKSFEFTLTGRDRRVFSFMFKVTNYQDGQVDFEVFLPDSAGTHLYFEYRPKQKSLFIRSVDIDEALRSSGSSDLYSSILNVILGSVDIVNCNVDNSETLLTIAQLIINKHSDQAKAELIKILGKSDNVDELIRRFNNANTWEEFCAIEREFNTSLMPNVFFKAIVSLYSDNSPEVISQTLLARARGDNFVHSFDGVNLTSYRVPSEFAKDLGQMRKAFRESRWQEAQSSAQLILTAIGTRGDNDFSGFNPEAISILRREATNILDRAEKELVSSIDKIVTNTYFNMVSGLLDAQGAAEIIIKAFDNAKEEAAFNAIDSAKRILSKALNQTNDPVIGRVVTILLKYSKKDDRQGIVREIKRAISEGEAERSLITNLNGVSFDEPRPIDLQDLLGDKLKARFKSLNEDNDVVILYPDSLGGLRASLGKIPDNQFVILLIRRNFFNRVCYRIVIDKAGYLKDNLSSIWDDDSLKLEGFEFAVDFKFFPTEKRIYWDMVSIGREHKDALRGNLARAIGGEGGLFSEFISFFAQALGQNGYSGMRLDTVIVEAKFKQAGQPLVIENLLRRYFVNVEIDKAKSDRLAESLGHPVTVLSCTVDKPISASLEKELTPVVANGSGVAAIHGDGITDEKLQQMITRIRDNQTQPTEEQRAKLQRLMSILKTKIIEAPIKKEGDNERNKRLLKIIDALEKALADSFFVYGEELGIENKRDFVLALAFSETGQIGIIRGFFDDAELAASENTLLHILLHEILNLDRPEPIEEENGRHRIHQDYVAAQLEILGEDDAETVRTVLRSYIDRVAEKYVATAVDMRLSLAALEVVTIGQFLVRSLYDDSESENISLRLRLFKRFKEQSSQLDESELAYVDAYSIEATLSSGNFSLTGKNKDGVEKTVKFHIELQYDRGDIAIKITAPEYSGVVIDIAYSSSKRQLFIKDVKMRELSDAGLYSKIIRNILNGEFSGEFDKVRTLVDNIESKLALVDLLRQKYSDLRVDLKYEFTEEELNAFLGANVDRLDQSPELTSQTLLARVRGDNFVHLFDGRKLEMLSYRIPVEMADLLGQARIAFRERNKTEAIRCAQQILSIIKAKYASDHSEAIRILNCEAENILIAAQNFDTLEVTVTAARLASGIDSTVYGLDPVTATATLPSDIGEAISDTVVFGGAAAPALGTVSFGVPVGRINVGIPALIIDEDGRVSINGEFSDPTTPGIIVEAYKRVVAAVIARHPEFLTDLTANPGKYINFYTLSDFKCQVFQGINEHRGRDLAKLVTEQFERVKNGQIASNKEAEISRLLRLSARSTQEQRQLDILSVPSRIVFYDAATAEDFTDENVIVVHKGYQSEKPRQNPYSNGNGFSVEENTRFAQYRKQKLVEEVEGGYYLVYNGSGSLDWVGTVTNLGIFIFTNKRDALRKCDELSGVLIDASQANGQENGLLPAEKMFLAEWRGKYFLFYTSRTTTHESAMSHQWRSANVLVGNDFSKSDPENLDDCSPELCVMLDEFLRTFKVSGYDYAILTDISAAEINSKLNQSQSSQYGQTIVNYKPNDKRVSGLHSYTGAGNTSIHVAFNQVRAFIREGKLREAIELLEELVQYLKPVVGETDETQKIEKYEVLMEYFNNRYPSTVQPDLIIDDIPELLKQAKQMLEVYQRILTERPEKINYPKINPQALVGEKLRAVFEELNNNQAPEVISLSGDVSAVKAQATTALADISDDQFVILSLCIANNHRARYYVIADQAKSLKEQINSICLEKVSLGSFKSLFDFEVDNERSLISINNCYVNSGLRNRKLASEAFALLAKTLEGILEYRGMKVVGMITEAQNEPKGPRESTFLVMPHLMEKHFNAREVRRMPSGAIMMEGNVKAEAEAEVFTGKRTMPAIIPFIPAGLSWDNPKQIILAAAIGLAILIILRHKQFFSWIRNKMTPKQSPIPYTISFDSLAQIHTFSIRGYVNLSNIEIIPPNWLPEELHILWEFFTRIFCYVEMFFKISNEDEIINRIMFVGVKRIITKAQRKVNDRLGNSVKQKLEEIDNIVRGNVNDANTCSILRHAVCYDAHPLVKQKAVWALGELRDKDAISLLENMQQVYVEKGKKEEVPVDLRLYEAIETALIKIKESTDRSDNIGAIHGSGMNDFRLLGMVGRILYSPNKKKLSQPQLEQIDRLLDVLLERLDQAEDKGIEQKRFSRIRTKVLLIKDAIEQTFFTYPRQEGIANPNNFVLAVANQHLHEIGLIDGFFDDVNLKDDEVKLHMILHEILNLIEPEPTFDAEGRHDTHCKYIEEQAQLLGTSAFAMKMVRMKLRAYIEGENLDITHQDIVAIEARFNFLLHHGVIIRLNERSEYPYAVNELWEPENADGGIRERKLIHCNNELEAITVAEKILVRKRESRRSNLAVFTTNKAHGGSLDFGSSNRVVAKGILTITVGLIFWTSFSGSLIPAAIAFLFEFREELYQAFFGGRQEAPEGRGGERVASTPLQNDGYNPSLAVMGASVTTSGASSLSVDDPRSIFLRGLASTGIDIEGMKVDLVVYTSASGKTIQVPVVYQDQVDLKARTAHLKARLATLEAGQATLDEESGGCGDTEEDQSIAASIRYAAEKLGLTRVLVLASEPVVRYDTSSERVGGIDLSGLNLSYVN
ncbi:MAG: hypothetical protein AB1755_06635 [Candidatus Omnitrophota bacterium]